MARRRILIVEDDPAIRRVMVDALRLEGYELLEAATFADAVRLAVQATCDLLLLDLVLPGGDGLDVLAQSRAVHPTLPVIILTARGSEADRVRGLTLGADDYVVKPFSVKELVARVEAVLRRSAERPSDTTQTPFVGGVIDHRRSELRFDDKTAVALSERELAVLRYLAQHAGRIISRDELLERVWNLPPHRVDTRAVDMMIARLREKLRNDAAITTVRGRGYRFEGA